MGNIFRYTIAGFDVQVESSLENSPLDRIEGFSLFRSDGKIDFDPVLRYNITSSSEELADVVRFAQQKKSLHSFEFDDEDIKCDFYRNGEQLIFRMVPQIGEHHYFVATNRGGRWDVDCNWEENKHRSMLRFSMWMAFAIAIAAKGGIPIHSSVIVHSGKAALFLGESGTGKSTHTRLWRENIEGAALLNDDSPILRAEGGKVMAYGSPWSGKTPCYKNESYPVAAIVRLSQAPQNKMIPLSKIRGFSAIYPSCPPAFAHDEGLSDHICAIISSILKMVPVYHLECLPDREAALLSFSYICNK